MPQPPDLARPPQQRRSRQSLQKALDAAVEVIATEGWDGFTVPEVSRRAGVSVPLIYRRFGTKDDLFRAAQAHGLEESERLIAGRLGPADISVVPVSQGIQEGVAAMAAVFASYSAFLRGLRDRAIEDPKVREIGGSSLRVARARFDDHLLQWRDSMTHPEPEQAVETCFRVLVATLDQEAQFGGPLTGQMNWDSVVRQLSDCCEAYLVADPRLTPGAIAGPRPWPLADPEPSTPADALVARAADELGQQGYGALAIAEFSAATRTSVGALYRMFGDKQGLVQAAERRALEQLFDDATWQFPGNLEELPESEALDQAIVRLSVVLARNRAAVQVLVGRHAQAGTRSLATATMASLRDLFVAALARPGRVQPPRTKEAEALCFRIAFAALTEFSSLGEEFELGLGPDTQDQFLTELANVCGEYLRAVGAQA